MSRKWHSNGKLLLTGEYLVLDGAVSLALPTKFGQSLEVKETEQDFTTWKALDHNGNTWFETSLRFTGSDFLPAENDANPGQPEKKLREILLEAHKLNPAIFGNNQNYRVTTELEFPQNWGLGSSSTLINNLSRWFETDPYELLKNTFGGSGYDIAAAQAEQPITYQLQENGRSVLNANFDPEFKAELFFVYLNRKQNSRSSIAHYRQQPADYLLESVQKASALTAGILSCTDINEFKLLLEIHETLISQVINTPKIKTRLFPDSRSCIKSLGGWGGDFVLATGGEEEKEYFRGKGYGTILGFEEMVGW